MLTSEYHSRQAVTLSHLAESTRDPHTAAALMRLAAEHIALLDRAESRSKVEARTVSQGNDAN
jgi:hypothetical protein